ncbi:LuxR C-terminal-related transcriptional regulator [Streptomyces goshikiensis]|uniref:helix-turn-helix transcriptional regulator n=1 Tax=Streptomyces goshikiensis TaxID=1942 RepID=UPI0033CA766B
MTSAAIVPLTDGQKRIARHLVHGATIDVIADREKVSRSTVRSHLGSIRANLNCPPRATRPVTVHALLTHGQVPRPPAPRPDIDLDSAEQLLLRAHAEHSHPTAVVAAAEIAPGNLRTKTRALTAKTGAANTTHLIGIGRALGLLSPAAPKKPGRTGETAEAGR